MDITKNKTQAPTLEPARQFYFMDLLKQHNEKKSAELGRKLTYHIETFGCQMNAKDSEKLAGILETAGYVPVDSEAADFVLYNTCTVRENANTKVYGRIGYLGNLKKKNLEYMLAFYLSILLLLIFHIIYFQILKADTIFGYNLLYYAL